MRRMTAIVWLHGFPLSPEMYAKQLAIGGYQHFVPDLRDPKKNKLLDELLRDTLQKVVRLIE